MSDSPYSKLQEFLDRFPLGFPRTDSGVEIRILRNLFTEEEARVAVLLSPMPEEASRIAGRAGIDEAQLASKLESMSKRGLIFRVRRRGRTHFSSAPFMIGLYEYLETCLSFGVAAEYYIENGLGREIGAEQALEILEDADRAGLVHAGANTRHLSNICNCCPCCCASMKGITTRGHDRVKYLNALYEAAIDPEACTGCGDCLQRCPVRAITLEDWARVNRDRCLGCGLCAGVCPVEAVALRGREDRQEPFERVLDLGLAILRGKEANAPRRE
jgi:ferredoxin